MGAINILKRGGDYGDVYKLFEGASIIAGQTLISDAVPLAARSNFGIWYKATSIIGGADVRLLYDQGPTSELGEFIIPDGATDIEASFGAQTNGITVQYVGLEASGTLQITGESIILCAPALTVVETFDLNDYPTLDAIIAAIDALADWTCTLHADADGDENSLQLKDIAATACKASAVTFVMCLPKSKNLAISPMRFLRIRAIGNTGTPADTLIWVYVFVQ